MSSASKGHTASHNVQYKFPAPHFGAASHNVQYNCLPPIPEPQVYGGLYQGGADAENPFGNEGVRVVRRMRVASSTEPQSDPARQRFLWCVPACGRRNGLDGVWM